MSAHNDGGPAFPGIKRETPPGMDPYDVPYVGMSLRDYFAGQAVGLLIPYLGTRGTDIAPRAYEIADAMLAERQKGSGS